MRKKVLSTLYNIGAITAFLGLSGIAESITGRGFGTASLVIFTAGLIMCTMDYFK